MYALHRAAFLFFLAGCSAELRYKRILKRIEAPGSQMTLIDAQGARWSGSTGLARPDRPMSGRTQMLVGSNTKMFTAAVVLQLVDEGALSLEDSAADLLPQLEEAITVRSLLQHTSGLGEYFDHDAMAADDRAAAQERWDPEDLIALGQEISWGPPGDIVRYANTNYIALGRIVELLQGEPLDQVIAHRITEPLGLSTAGLMVDDEPADLAWGDGGAYGKGSLWDPSVGWSAGALYTDTDDLARFLGAVFAGELYSEDLLAEQLTPAPWDTFDGDGADIDYGLGMMVARVNGGLYYGHQGGLLGFTSFSLYDPATGAIMTLASNATEVDLVSPGFKALSIAARQ